jgi:hypothetical protein
MGILRKTLNQGLPPEIAENIIKFLPRPREINSGTIHSEARKLNPLRNPPPKGNRQVKKTIAKRN